VYSTEAISSAFKSHPTEMLDMKGGGLLRLKCEMAIRKQLNIVTDRLNDVTSQMPDIEVDEEGEENDDGSDSDPSVDNIPAFKLFGKKNVGGLRDSKNLIKALHKSVRKRRRAAEKKDAKKERKRILEEQEAG
jgi:hypothetical protein